MTSDELQQLADIIKSNYTGNKMGERVAQIATGLCSLGIIWLVGSVSQITTNQAVITSQLEAVEKKVDGFASDDLAVRMSVVQQDLASMSADIERVRQWQNTMNQKSATFDSHIAMHNLLDK